MNFFAADPELLALKVSGSSTIADFMQLAAKFISLCKDNNFKLIVGLDNHITETDSDTKAITVVPHVNGAARGSISAMSKSAGAKVADNKHVEHKLHPGDGLVREFLGKKPEYYKTHNWHEKCFDLNLLGEYVTLGNTGREKVQRLRNVLQIFQTAQQAKYLQLSLKTLEFIAAVNSLHIADIDAEFDWLFFVKEVCLKVLALYQSVGTIDFYYGCLKIIELVLVDKDLTNKFSVLEIYGKWYRDTYAVWEKANEKVKLDERTLPPKFKGDAKGVNADLLRSATQNQIVFNSQSTLYLLDAGAFRHDFALHAEKIIKGLVLLLSNPAYEIHYLKKEIEKFKTIHLPELARLTDNFKRNRSVEAAEKLSQYFYMCDMFNDRLTLSGEYQNEAEVKTYCDLYGRPYLDAIQKLVTETLTAADFARLNPQRKRFEFLFTKMEFEIATIKALARQKADSKAGAATPRGTSSDKPSPANGSATQRKSSLSDMKLTAAATTPTPKANGDSCTATPAAGSAAARVFAFGSPISDIKAAVVADSDAKPPLLPQLSVLAPENDSDCESDAEFDPSAPPPPRISA